jgi:hypothetical protein
MVDEAKDPAGGKADANKTTSSPASAPTGVPRGTGVPARGKVDANKVKCLIELAKTNQENLWKRRSIEWKVNFGLWTALGIVTGFSYSEGVNFHPVGVGVVLFLVFAAYVWNNLGTIISNEKDLDWIIYYKVLAENELTPENKATRKRPNPEWSYKHYIWRGGRKHKAKRRWDRILRLIDSKLHTVFAPTMVTLSLLLVLGLIVSGVIHKGQEAGKSPTSSSPSASQTSPTAGPNQTAPVSGAPSAGTPPTTPVPSANQVPPIAGPNQTAPVPGKPSTVVPRTTPTP